jgi:hypothetical protein
MQVLPYANFDFIQVLRNTFHTNKHKWHSLIEPIYTKKGPGRRYDCTNGRGRVGGGARRHLNSSVGDP